MCGSTKEGANHLKWHLENICKKYQKNSINQIFIVLSSKDPMKPFKFNQEQNIKFLTKLFIFIDLLFWIFMYFFLDFMRFVQPLFNIIDCKIIRSDCMALYQVERKNCMIDIRN